MSFSKVICWDAAKIRDVIHTDAEAAPDSIFLAIHTDPDLDVSGPGITSSSMKPEEFLHNYFLAENQENEVMTVVKGESGSGKSHLIQWMRLNIPKSKDTHVLTIPKSKTNLKNILELLINELSEEQKKEYGEKLHGSMGSLHTIQQKTSKLLDNIAISIQTSDIEADSEMEEYLAEQLPHLFRDPYFSKEFFNEQHTVISNLVEHIFGDAGVNAKAEKKQEFTQDHLPLNAANATKAAGPTREILDAISSDPEILEAALNLINKNLDKAISYTMSFSPEDLIQLMIEIRKDFYKEGKKLILLIEDFALLQGVDTALLQALITRSSESEKLCELRWAMAVTTGYFTKIVDTVQTRITFTINMDVPWDGDLKKKQNYIKHLGVTYLNAVRHGSEAIERWYKEYENHTDKIASKCDTCIHKTECFKAFGSVNNIGLYPFNDNALIVMARHADREKQDKFRPREFINKVLVRNLNTQAADQIKLGEYPSPTLLKDFPTNLMHADEIEKLSRIDIHNAARRRVLLELWGGTGELVNLNEGIHEAFSISKLENIGDFKPKEDISKPVIEQPISGDDSRLEVLNKWAQGAELRQSDADVFRKLLYSAVENAINWDFLPVAKSQSGILKFFERKNIYFLNQQTRKPTSGFVLPIPFSEEEKDIPKVQVVIKTLYLLDKKKHFEVELDVLARVQEYIQEIARYVVKHLKEQFMAQAEWNPFSASLELLILSSITTNALKPSEGTTNVALHNAILKDPVLMNQLAKNHDIVKQLITKRVIFQDLLKQTFTGRKGGSSTTAFLDVKSIISTIRNLRKNNWRLSQNPVLEKRKEFEDIAKIYMQWQESYMQILTNEIEERKGWLVEIKDKILIEDIDKRKLRSVLEGLRTKVKELGVSGHTSARLDELLEMNFVKAKQALQKSEELSKQPIDNIKLPELFPANVDEAKQFILFVNTYEQLLDNIKNSLVHKRRELVDNGNSPEEMLEEIKITIEEIDVKLQSIMGEDHVA